MFGLVRAELIEQRSIEDIELPASVWKALDEETKNVGITVADAVAQCILRARHGPAAETKERRKPGRKAETTARRLSAVAS